MICLVTAHGLFAGLVPRAGGFAIEIVLADQGFLDRLSAL
jgi:hypothetical protein